MRFAQAELLRLEQTQINGTKRGVNSRYYSAFASRAKQKTTRFYCHYFRFSSSRYENPTAELTLVVSQVAR